MWSHKHSISNFLWSGATHQISQDRFYGFLFLTVCVLIQSLESHAAVYLSIADFFLFYFPFYTISSLSTDPHLSVFIPPRLSVWLSVRLCLHALKSSSPPLMLTSHIHYCMALAQSALFPSVVLNYSVFLGQALVSSHCNDFLIICLYVMNEMEMYHHGQTELGLCQAAMPCSGCTGAGSGGQQNK